MPESPDWMVIALVRGLTKSELKIWKAYQEPRGRTEKEALDKTHDKPKKRQHKTIRKRLLDKGLIVDLTPDRGGPLPHIYMAVDDLVECERRGNQRPTIGKEDYELGRAIRIVYEMAWDAIAYIGMNEAWRKPKRIAAICDQHVRPTVTSILSLWRAGCRITPPWDFFQDEKPPHLKGIFRTPDLRGTLGVRSPGHSGEEGWTFPSLVEWDQYLRKIMDELAEPYATHMMLIPFGIKPTDGIRSKHRQSWESLGRDGMV